MEPNEGIFGFLKSVPRRVGNFLSGARNIGRTPSDPIVFTNEPDPTPQPQVTPESSLDDLVNAFTASNPNFTRSTPQPDAVPKIQRRAPSGDLQGLIARNAEVGLPGFQSPTPPTDVEGFNILDLILQNAQRTGLPPEVLAAVLFQESSFNPDFIFGRREPNPGDVGISQIHLPVHPVTREQAIDPSFAIPFAADLLRSDIDAFGGDFNRGIAAYNVGRGGASVQGPERFGGGPRGQFYLDNVTRNLTDQLIQELGLQPSEGFR